MPRRFSGAASVAFFAGRAPVPTNQESLDGYWRNLAAQLHKSRAKSKNDESPSRIADVRCERPAPGAEVERGKRSLSSVSPSRFPERSGDQGATSRAARKPLRVVSLG